MIAMIVFLLVGSGVVGPAAAESPPFDTAAIERASGAKGTWIAAEGVFKVSLPRSELSVTTEGVRLTPPMGLTSWASFRRSGSRAIVMGDVVLTEERVAPTMDAALMGGLEITALHNHFAGDSPRIMFMHVAGAGDAPQLAESVGRVFAASRGVSAQTEPVRIDPANSTLDRQALDRALGVRGDYSSGVYKAVVGRETRMHGETLGAAMGVNTWAAMAGTMERAVVDGDVVMKETELQPVLRALRKAGIRIVAIHNHMTGEEPRLVFLHYWGIGPAAALAGSIRTALALTREPL